MNYNLRYSSTPVKYIKQEMIEYCMFKGTYTKSFYVLTMLLTSY